MTLTKFPSYTSLSLSLILLLLLTIANGFFFSNPVQGWIYKALILITISIFFSFFTLKAMWEGKKADQLRQQAAITAGKLTTTGEPIYRLPTPDDNGTPYTVRPGYPDLIPLSKNRDGTYTPTSLG